jgi:hypothetical protein
MKQRILDGALVSAICMTAAIPPAWAGIGVATPAPIVGLGIPALIAFGYAYRRLRRRIGE